MRERHFDAVVIGGGAAGMAAALRIAQDGFSTAIVEREEGLGGILMQCIHNGFGLHRFKEELTGPEFAERLIEQVTASKIAVFLNTTVMEIVPDKDCKKLVVCGPDTGVMQLNARAVVLAMGCRERNRGNLGIPGTRPSGIFTAGLAQRLVNIEGYVPGRKVVVIGSGDIGLIMARRMHWVGAEVLGVVEILPFPSGITRNIVQCLQDFKIPLYLSHVVTRIDGRDRVEGVEVSPLENGTPDKSRAFYIPCDTVLLSVGLVPENELSQNAGVRLSHDTGGPVVDAGLMTNVEGVFACGNVLHVHDLVDWVAEEAERCGDSVLAYLNARHADAAQGAVTPGANVKYVVPHRYLPGTDTQFSLRALVVKDRAELVVRRAGAVIKRRVLRHVKPAEMIYFKMSGADLPPADLKDAPAPLEIAVE